MDIIVVLIVAALVFGVCFLVDKAFTRLFRNQAEHHSGTAVRLNKKYGAFGLILCVLGLGSLFYGLQEPWVMIAAGCLLMAMGVGLVVYYMSYGIYYAQDSFLVTAVGKKTTRYAYRDIQNQQLYNNYGQLLIELYMSDGKVVQVQSGMEGAFTFMDHAFAAWLRQTGRKVEDCPFHDPANSCWFPPVEG